MASVPPVSRRRRPLDCFNTRLRILSLHPPLVPPPRHGVTQSDESIGTQQTKEAQ